jgi:peptidoglycan/LPS O-acetylase OafA/YrhL
MQSEPSTNPTTNSLGPARVRLFAAAVAFTVFAIYGSLAPFHFRPLAWHTALERFREVASAHVGIGSRGDCVANILLFVPLAFLWLGTLTAGRSRWAAVAGSVVLIPLLAGLSATIEFAQLWFPPRVSSPSDIVANTAGGAAGVGLWLLFGPATVRRLQSVRRLSGPLEWLLAAYLAGLVLYSVVPLDITIRPGELYEKLKAGRVLVVPFTRHYGSTVEAVFHLGASTLLAVPVGALAALWLRGRSKAGSPFAAPCLLGVALMASIEATQVLVYSQNADMTDLVLGSLGAVFGVALTDWLTRGALSDRTDRASDVGTHKSGPTGAGGPGRVAGLDGLRAMACLAVFGVHLQQMTGLKGTFGPIDLQRLLENGNTGVCLFFILSGAVLSLPLWQKDFQPFSRGWLLGYAGRRLVRIVPAYYACLIPLILVRRHWHGVGEVLDTTLHLLFLQNCREQSFYGFTPPFWTIAVQMQFYLLLPLIFWALARCKPARPGRGLLLLGLLAGSYLAHCWIMENGRTLAAWLGQPGLFDQQPTVFSHSVLAHLPHLLLGVLAGFYLTDGPWPRAWLAASRRWVWDALFWGALVTIGLILGTTWDDLLQVPHGRYNFPYIPLLAALLIVSTPRSRTALWVLEKTRLGRLGAISYGVYVYHYPLMRLADHAMTRLHLPVTTYWHAFAALSLGLSVVAAWLSFRLLEEPLLRRVRPAR